MFGNDSDLFSTKTPFFIVGKIDGDTKTSGSQTFQAYEAHSVTEKDFKAWEEYSKKNPKAFIEDFFSERFKNQTPIKVYALNFLKIEPNSMLSKDLAKLPADLVAQPAKQQPQLQK